MKRHLEQWRAGQFVRVQLRAIVEEEDVRPKTGTQVPTQHRLRPTQRYSGQVALAEEADGHEPAVCSPVLCCGRERVAEEFEVFFSLVLVGPVRDLDVRLVCA